MILVAIDGTETSLRAGAFVAGLVRGSGVRVVCLYVRTLMPLATPSLVELGLADQDLKQEIADELRAQVNLQGTAMGLNVEFVERTGNVFTEIVDVATELRADSIVVGASTHAGIRIVSAMGARLIRLGRWPITVVP